MVGKILKTIYKYDEVVLVGATVSASEVTIQEGKVSSIVGGIAKVGERVFNFSIYSNGINGEMSYNLNNVPANIDGQAIVRDFVVFVEDDIA